MRSEVDQQINKRLYLNLLAQGAATDCSLRIDTRFTDHLSSFHDDYRSLYEVVSLSLILSQYQTPKFLFGRRDKFWRNVDRPGQVFANNAVFVRHGHELSKETYIRSVLGMEALGLVKDGDRYHHDIIGRVDAMTAIECEQYGELQDMAVRYVSEEWGIDEERLVGFLTWADPGPMLEDTPKAATLRGRLMTSCAVGWSRVEARSDGPPLVVAVGKCLPILVHELVKGTVELLMLHGLAELHDDLYAEVIAATDHIEYERPMFEVGPTLYRRWLEIVPSGVTDAEGLMRVAKQDPDVVESLMLATIEDPEAASEIMSHICDRRIVDT